MNFILKIDDAENIAAEYFNTKNLSNCLAAGSCLQHIYVRERK